ncbi:MAG: CopG family transcriptional regulator [Hyphomicrobiaceae bacterium]
MTSDGKLAPKKSPWGSKKRYSILLSEELAERFERVARLRNGAKSALVEEALDRRLHPEKYPLIDDALLRRLDEQAAGLATLKRDAAINTEMISLFVRYFLTITPPLADSEQQPARALGRQRFEVFVAQIGRRLASDRRLVSDVLESIAVHNPDLFATATDDAPLKPPPPKSQLRPTVVSLKTNGQKPPAGARENGHG